MKVLIAEDNAVARKVLEKQVTGWGYEPIVVEDGEKAWQALQPDDAPRLAILDWLMPGMDGIEICRRIKEDNERPFTYVIMLSGQDSDEDIVAGLDAGADDYLTKPAVPNVLRSRLLAAGRIVQAVPPKEWTTPRVSGYDVKRLLGKGAFATVWEATEESTGRTVALKIIRADLATHEVLGRFEREIKLMRKLHHANIADVYESNSGSSQCYYAMEYIDGCTLDTFTKVQKPKALRLLQLIAQVCDALDYAHQRGIVHRDLKPSNIMVTREKIPKVVDFGLSKAIFRSDAELDPSQSLIGSVVGTPLFMAPEQARGENDKIDGRTDVYVLGVLLYVLFVRRHPFSISNKNRWQMVHEVAVGQVHPPSERMPGFDKDLEAIVMKALADEPCNRFQTAAEFGQALRDFIQRRIARKKSQ